LKGISVIRQVSIPIGDAVELYLEERRLDLAVSTWDHCARDFRRFARQCLGEGDRADVVRFLSTAKSPNTYNLYRALLVTFYDWAIRQGYRTDNPAASIRGRKGTNRFVDIEVSRLAPFLKEGFDLGTYSGLRNRTAILFLIDTGMRPNEAWQLRWADVDLGSRTVAIRSETSKTRAARVGFFSPPTAQELRRLLAARPEEWPEDTPIFATETGRGMTSGVFSHEVRPAAERFGLHLTAYSFRHIFATNFLRNGGNVMELQRILGHANISMTSLYANLNAADLRRAHEAASPVKGLYGEPRKRAPRKIPRDPGSRGNPR
jgi:integrase